ncbi:MAG: hypothetical protein ACC645_14855 [Pirellulales bacterium]
MNDARRTAATAFPATLDEGRNGLVRPSDFTLDVLRIRGPAVAVLRAAMLPWKDDGGAGRQPSASVAGRDVFSDAGWGKLIP